MILIFLYCCLGSCEVELVVEENSTEEFVEWSDLSEVLVVDFAARGWVNTDEIAPFPLQLC